MHVAELPGDSTLAEYTKSFFRTFFFLTPKGALAFWEFWNLMTFQVVEPTVDFILR